MELCEGLGPEAISSELRPLIAGGQKAGPLALGVLRNLVFEKDLVQPNTKGM